MQCIFLAVQSGHFTVELVQLSSKYGLLLFQLTLPKLYTATLLRHQAANHISNIAQTSSRESHCAEGTHLVNAYRVKAWCG